MSLAVKYRPKDFESLVGQTFVKETLREAVKEDKLVGAYLFCGPRGTGKTSVARMMAKTINCLNPVGGNPCHKCEICVSIGDNKLMDIIEIDAASNTGVDNIRDLIERAQFLPNVAKYKVYIIDEVHMLSTGAFNALLKILEEPPSFVKFILATTEIHKIPETILSRCQRYDFKNIGDADLKARLEYIAKEEKIKTDSKSIDFIVKNSHGGLRNAITLFEQFIFNSEIVFDNIIKNMGITESSFVKEFLDKLMVGDKSVVNDFDTLIDNGKNVKLFFKDLIYQVRDEIMTNISTSISICELNQVLEILDETYSKTKNSMDEKITLLSGILRVVTRTERCSVKSTSSSVILGLDPGISSKVKHLENSKDSEISKSNSSKVDSKSSGEPIDSGSSPEGQFKKREPKKEFEKFEVCDLDIGEALDVFGGDDEEKKSETSSNNTGFKRDDFIAKVKELGGKGSVTMGLRGSEIKFDGTNLSIKAPSKMALNSFQDVSSKEVIVHAMDDLGFSDVKLKVE